MVHYRLYMLYQPFIICERHSNLGFLLFLVPQKTNSLKLLGALPKTCYSEIHHWNKPYFYNSYPKSEYYICPLHCYSKSLPGLMYAGIVDKIQLQRENSTLKSMQCKFTKAIPMQGPHFKTLPQATKVLLVALINSKVLKCLSLPQLLTIRY